MFQNAEEIIQIIEQRRNRGYGLEHFKKYMNEIHNPHENLTCIHVAGTNGKGSTTNDIRSILQVAGYRVATFTSPYMVTHLDRIRINDVNIAEEDFVCIANAYYESWIAWDLSMFEIDMCIACVYFQQKHVDICVFEVGLGGRLDFTNIISPLVSVITNIGLDHMDLLGDTYEKIAREKAGIIKKHTALITAENKEECLNVFRDVCSEMDCVCIRVGEVQHLHYKDTHCVFDYKEYKEIELANGAKYQCYNAALAIEVMTYLQVHHQIICNAQAIREGLQKASWAGRFEVVSEEPRIILDGAHNAEGIQALCESLQDIQNPVVIFSVLKDKNFHLMLEELQKVSDYIILTQLQHNERALDIYEIQESDIVHLIYAMEDALQQAIALHRPIIITGSLYFISEVRKLFMK